MIEDYDKSTELVTDSHFFKHAIRWDSLFFIEIMENDYRYFKNHAFGYGIVLLGKLFSNSLICLLILQKICNAISTQLIYNISMHYSNNNHKFSQLSALLFIFTPASVFFNSLYTESFFAFLVLVAIYLQIKQKTYQSSIVFALSIHLRSNGMFFILYSGYPYLVKAIILVKDKKFKQVIATIIEAVPIALIYLISIGIMLYLPYKNYCQQNEMEWCKSIIPYAYGYIQKNFWDVSFLSSYKLRKLFFIYWGMQGILIQGFWLYKWITKSCIMICKFILCYKILVSQYNQEQYLRNFNNITYHNFIHNYNIYSSYKLQYEILQHSDSILLVFSRSFLQKEWQNQQVDIILYIGIQFGRVDSFYKLFVMGLIYRYIYGLSQFINLYYLNFCLFQEIPFSILRLQNIERCQNYWKTQISLEQHSSQHLNILKPNIEQSQEESCQYYYMDSVFRIYVMYSFCGRVDQHFLKLQYLKRQIKIRSWNQRKHMSNLNLESLSLHTQIHSILKLQYCNLQFTIQKMVYLQLKYKYFIIYIEPPVPIFVTQELNSKFYTISISNFLLSISQSKSEIDPEIEMMLTLGRCQDHLLQGDQKCANDSIMNNYFMQPTNTIILRQFMKEFNTVTESIDTIGREQMISIQSNFTFQVQTYIRIQETNVDTGALFESVNKYKFITDYRGSNSILGLDYFNNILRYDLFVALYYKLDNIQQEQTIIYPKLSEVLAEAGSIASTIFLLSYLVVMINQKQLQFEAVNDVIGMYYPDFKQIKITKNIFGQLSKVQKNDRLLDLITFKKQYQKLVKIGETKLSISNQIYEISRIQFILHSIFTSSYMNQFHLHGIPFQINGYETQKEDQGSTVKLEMSLNQEINSIKQSSIVPVSINEKNQDTLLSTQQNFNMRPSKSSNLMVINSKDGIEGQKTDYKEYKDFDFSLLILQNGKDEKEEKDDGNNTQQNQ